MFHYEMGDKLQRCFYKLADYFSIIYVFCFFHNQLTIYN